MCLDDMRKKNLKAENLNQVSNLLIRAFILKIFTKYKVFTGKVKCLFNHFFIF